MEVWDLYTRERILTGCTHVRGKIVPEGFYHLVVHVWICNSKGEFLISQRSLDCSKFPLMWECVGGSVLKGEDSLTGALREVKEEIGLVLSPQNGRLLTSKVREYFRDIKDVWLFEYNGQVSLKDATTNEVKRVEWMTPTQIENLFRKKLMVPTLRYFFADICSKL